MTRLLTLIALALFAGAGQAQPTIGSSGWTCNLIDGDASLDGETITIDTGSDRTLIFTIGRGFDTNWDVNQIDIGGVSPTGSENLLFDTNGGRRFTAVWSESEIGSMSGSTIEFETTAPSGSGRYCYSTLTNSNQSNLASFAHLAEAEDAAVTEDDVDTTSTADDFVCVGGLNDSTSTSFLDGGWDTLTEVDDASTAQGHRSGLGCGTGGDNITTIEIASSQELMLASMVFSEPAEACVPCLMYYYRMMQN